MKNVIAFLLLLLLATTCKKDDPIPPAPPGNPPGNPDTPCEPAQVIGLPSLPVGWEADTLNLFNCFNHYFLDEKTGFGSNGSNLYRTTDGGENSNLIFEYTSGDFRKMQFLDTQRGILVAQNLFDPAQTLNQNRTAIFKTSDGGATWTKVTSQLDGQLMSFHFQNENEGFGFWFFLAGTASFSIKLGNTSDGGLTWTFKENFPTSSGVIRMLDGLRGFVDGPSGLIYKTLDGGKNWSPIYTPAGAIADFHFFDEENGLVSSVSNLYKTSDGGKNWDLVYPARATLLHIMSAAEFLVLTEESCLSGDVLYRNFSFQLSQNGGKDWEKGKTADGFHVEGYQSPQPGLIFFRENEYLIKLKKI